VAVAAQAGPTRPVLPVRAVSEYLYGNRGPAAVYVSVSYASRAFLSPSGRAAASDLSGGRVSRRGGVAVAVAEPAGGGGIWAVGEQLDAGMATSRGDLL